LLVLSLECYCDEKGSRYLDQLWYKDLIEHFRYLKNFTLASPCAKQEPPEDTIAVDNDPLFSGVNFIDLPSPKSFAQAIMSVPTTALLLWKAIGQADIVHSSVAGWPIPLGWLVTPIVKLRKKPYVLIVESAFWRLQPGIPATIQASIRAYISEVLNRWCVNNADLSVFTQQEYQKSLLTKGEERGHVINASWIDEENIITDADATKIWRKKVSSSTQELKILFAGRLIPSKGVLILLEAMKLLDEENIPVKLDIFGQGELFSECEKASKSLKNSVNISMRGTVSYGREFLQLLQKYHAVVVPSLSDEQPRIVYDAYSQAVPLLASDTAGLRECIQNGKTGMLTRSNDPVALADLFKWSLQNMKQLESMGMTTLKIAHSLTHQKMHQKRWSLLLKMVDKSANP
jgi:glycosyltransferase involved in cell wall biosynthesis